MDVSVSLTIIAGLLLINTSFIVVVALKASRAFSEMHKFAEMARLQLAPVTHDATQIMSSIRSIVKTAEKEMVKIEDSFTAVRDTARNIKEFEELVQQRIERPILELTAIMSGVLKGGRVFWQSFRKS